MMTANDKRLLRIAYEEAKVGYEEGGCSIGSVLACLAREEARSAPDTWHVDRGLAIDPAIRQ